MSDCYCDYVYPEFWSEKQRRAKHEHKCGECRRTIQAGEYYEYACGKVEGYFDAYRTCNDCRNFRIELSEVAKCFCWAWENMLDDAHDCINEWDRSPERWIWMLKLARLKYRAIREHRLRMAYGRAA